MAYRGVAVLKFVGTVSLGLLTGLSFTLSTVTVPTLLTLPSARTAAKAFRSLADAAAGQLQALSGVASSAFLLAYLLSPRAVRHPYLLYTSLLVLGGRLATADALVPYLFSSSPSPSSPPPPSSADPFESASPASPAASPTRPYGLASSHAHMEASYEVLGSATAGSVSGGSVSDAHSDGGLAAADAKDATDAKDAKDGQAAINGEEVRAAVEVFLKRQIVRTALSGAAFAIAIVGLWGDGSAVVPVWQSETFIVV